VTNRGAPEATSPPLGLYVHIPWCVRKCPYCDFNSHAAQGELEEQAYVDALLTDLAREEAGGRVVETLFIGGGTPSLFSGEAITRLLQGIRDTLDLASDTEITLEANPGAVDAAHFEAYREAGVNRLSIGIQSFDGDALQRLGRIHDARQAVEAFETARAAGFENINLDLMFGLPQQLTKKMQHRRSRQFICMQRTLHIDSCSSRITSGKLHYRDRPVNSRGVTRNGYICLLHNRLQDLIVFSKIGNF